MEVKIVNLEQTAALRVNDILKRFPSTKNPEEFFDAGRENAIDLYKIRSINLDYGVIELAMTGSSVPMFAKPCDIGRLYIKPAELILASVWWRVEQSANNDYRTKEI